MAIADEVRLVQADGAGGRDDRGTGPIHEHDGAAAGRPRHDLVLIHFEVCRERCIGNGGRR